MSDAIKKKKKKIRRNMSTVKLVIKTFKLVLLKVEFILQIFPVAYVVGKIRWCIGIFT